MGTTTIRVHMLFKKEPYVCPTHIPLNLSLITRSNNILSGKVFEYRMQYHINTLKKISLVRVKKRSVYAWIQSKYARKRRIIWDVWDFLKHLSLVSSLEAYMTCYPRAPGYM